jgi:hypothetical protein
MLVFVFFSFLFLACNAKTVENINKFAKLKQNLEFRCRCLHVISLKISLATLAFQKVKYCTLDITCGLVKK